MRSFFRAHWKVIVGIILLVLLALLTVNPGAASPEPPLALRLRAHVAAFGSGAHLAGEQARRLDAAAYIAGALRAAGYRVASSGDRDASGPFSIEATLSNPAPGVQPRRSFVIGARVDATSVRAAAAAHADLAPDGAAGLDDALAGMPEDDADLAALDARDDAGGAAAVLELARLLKDLRPSAGTEIRFVFFLDAPAAAAAALPARAQPARRGRLPRAPDADPLPGGGSFIAFAGPLSSARRVQDALAAFQGGSEAAGHGLAAPAYLQGVTLSDRAALGAGGGDAPVMMVTDTGFTRYPYHQVLDKESARDPRDYEGMARVVAGLARTVAALAAGARS